MGSLPTASLTEVKIQKILMKNKKKHDSLDFQFVILYTIRTGAQFSTFPDNWLH